MKVNGDTGKQVLIYNEVKGCTLYLTMCTVHVTIGAEYQLGRLWNHPGNTPPGAEVWRPTLEEGCTVPWVDSGLCKKEEAVLAWLKIQY